MSETIEKDTSVVAIYELEEKYVGRRIDIEKFNKTFEPNGTGGDYRYYFAEDEDLAYFAEAYEQEDPRILEFAPKYGEWDNKDALEEYVSELPYPDISLFAEIKTDEKGDTILTSLGVSKVYPTGCITPGSHSDILIKAEVDRIDSLMSIVLVK